MLNGIKEEFKSPNKMFGLFSVKGKRRDVQ